MVRIVLFCNAGMSTSLLINKMLTQAATEGFACTVDAFATANAAEEGKNADVILLGPQVRHELKRIRGLFPDIPVEPIDMMAYGRMDGEAVLSQVKSLIK